MLTSSVTPYFYCIFFNVHIMNVSHAKFQKSLIVEQIQGNYLKLSSWSLPQTINWHKHVHYKHLQEQNF